MLNVPINGARAVKFARRLIDKYQLDCTGLTILTEAASGAYLYNPLIALMAGAHRVITYCRDSHYGRADEVREAMEATYVEVGLQDAYEFRVALTRQDLADADIVTNSGHLRPFDANFLEGLKDTAVIPLMWEPWELRPGEIDIDVAKRRGILILGTNEHEAPCDLRPYSFLTALHIAMTHKASIADDRVLVIGEQFTLALPIEEGFHRIGVACRRLSPGASQQEAEEAARWATYIVVAEHADHRRLIGSGGLVETQVLVESGTTGVGVLSGSVDRDDLEAQGISVYPSTIAPAGYMSYMPSELGPYPVMELFAAGIKVGQTMARARLRGLSVSEAAKYSLENSPAMDLEGDMAWI